MLSPKKKLLFSALLLGIAIATIEAMSFVIWKMAVGASERKSIRALCGQVSDEPTLLPNAFWHHEFNRNCPRYKGIINAKGTKGEDFEVPKPDGELRVVCIGDSTVEGPRQPNQTFPHFLEEMIRPIVRESPNYTRVRVINAGIGSHNSAFNLAYLEFRLIHYDPDIIIIKSSYNDYVPYCVPGMQFDYTHAFPNPFHLQHSNNPYWSMARYSYFLKMCGKAIFSEEVNIPFKDFTGHITREQFQEMDFSANEDKLYIYAENIRSMILLCKGRNIKVFVLDLPTSPNPDHYGRSRPFGKRFRNLISRLEAELKRVTSEENVPFIITGPLEENDFTDHCHNTVSGNRKIAGRISEILAEHLGQKIVMLSD